MTHRGTTNRNARGSAANRRARRQYLADTFGDGFHVACRYCWTTLTVDTVSADRILPGCHGGTYRRDNIQPACLPCNSSHGATLRRLA